MTNIYPNELPIEVQNDPRREGERIVFKKLKQLEANFEIFYSVDWTSKSKKNWPRRDGECDFIILHKDLGIICFEVKGGNVFKEINNFGVPKYFSKDKNGNIHSIKDAYRQAKKTKNLIIDKWNEYKRDAFINIQHAVIFPETKNPGEYETINDLPEITLFEDDMKMDIEKLTLKVYDLFNAHASDKYDPINDDGLKYLKDVILSIIPLREKLSEVFTYQNKQIEINTQNFLSNYLTVKDAFFNKIIFQGGAGTGKTQLAIEIAKSFSKSGNTLLLCFNRGLKNFLNSCIFQNQNIKIMSINECISHLSIKKFNEAEIVDSILKKNFFFESIIIDEAQDFKQEWWNIIFNSINNKKSHIYIFIDNNQKIYNQNHNLLFIKKYDFKSIALSKNYRNTKNIHNLISAFYDGTNYENSSLRGEKVRLIEKLLDFEKQIIELLSKLIHQNGVYPNQISILTAIPTSDSNILNIIDNSIFKSTTCENPIENHIVIDSIQRYKGLENDVVILLHSSEKDNDLNLIYTGLSRAKLLLYVIDENSFLSKMGKIIKTNF